MIQKKRFFLNAVALTATSLLMRAVGVAFNVYLSAKIGAAGMGLYSLIMSVYTFAVTFATSGINLAVTRVISEELGKQNAAGVRRAMRSSICYALCFGGAACVLLFCFAEPLGTYCLSDTRTISSLKLLSVTLPFIALSSVMNGYFTAVRRVVKNAAVTIVEQAVKISLTVMLLNLFVPKGLEYACLALVGGACISEGGSFFLSWLLYRLDRRRHLSLLEENGEAANVTGRILRISLPIALSAYVRSGLLTVEHILIPIGLRKFGALGDDALASYGIIHGMVMPVILFPAAFLSAFSGLIIPELSEFHVKGNTSAINSAVKRVFQITMLFAIGISGIFICFSRELGLALYQSEEAGIYIRVIAALIPVMYLDTMVDSMLKGLDQQVASMRYNIMDVSLCVVMVYTLLPIGGIWAYIAIIFISELFNASLSIGRLLSVTDIRVRFCRWALQPIFCILGATSLSQIVFGVFGIHFRYSSTSLIIHIAVTALCYLLFLKLTGGLSKDDIAWFQSIFRFKKSECPPASRRKVRGLSKRFADHTASEPPED